MMQSMGMWEMCFDIDVLYGALGLKVRIPFRFCAWI